MVAALTSLYVLLTTTVVVAVIRRHPHKTLFQYMRKILGPRLGWFVVMIIALLGAGSALVDLFMAIRVVFGVLLIATPLWAVAGLIGGAALYMAWFGLEKAARSAPLMMLILLVTFGVSVALLWQWTDPGYLRPLFDIGDINPGARQFWAAFGVCRTPLFLAAMWHMLGNPNRDVRAFRRGMRLGLGVVAVASVIPVMVFGPEAARILFLPFPYVISVVAAPNFPTERVELLARMILSLGAIYAVGATYYLTGRMLAELFSTRYDRLWMAAVAVATVVGISIMSREQLLEVVSAWILIAIAGMGPLFALLWVVDRRRDKRSPRGV